MSSPKQGSLTQTKLNTPTIGTTLNPNAVEFVPSSLRLSSGPTNIVDVAPKFPDSSSSSKSMLDRLELSISTNTDEEAQQYWQQQLPDDITPDFNIGGEYDHSGLGSLSLSSLSLYSGNEANRFSEDLDLSDRRSDGGYPSSTSYLLRDRKPWEMQFRSDHVFGNGQDGSLFEEMAGKPAIMENNDMHPVEFLASRFPGFAAHSVAEVYLGNGCDLNLTIEMLTQLELQVDGSKNQNMNPKTTSSPNLTSMDFPTLNSHGSSGNDNLCLFRSSSSLSAKGPTDFASALRKLSSQDASLWKYDRSGSVDVAVGSSRSSHGLSGSYNTSGGRSAFSDRLSGRSSNRGAPVWLETGDAVANLYSDVRGEARDHARIRNVYFEQARQAYLMGNKALAKELSVKGQMHNMQMKEAHSKAQESIYRQRNPISGEHQGGWRSQEKMIDLHGLHVSEALHVLKQELNVLRHKARLGGQRLYIYICVGTGHHTRGSRTPARLPIAVQSYLLDEGLQFSEPQAGLLRVVLY